MVEEGDAVDFVSDFVSDLVSSFEGEVTSICCLRRCLRRCLRWGISDENVDMSIAVVQQCRKR